ncbi:hypothetical protein [Aquabacterium sp.]|uniref:hypothetical protein n=1 Tax=Aquabacterium sp. TaxID=1872578 RepID=UPI0040383660
MPPPEIGCISGTFWLASADATSDFRVLATALPHVTLMPSHQRRAIMWRIKTVTGTIIESSRFTNKPMHWHERPVCNERRELWLATSHEDERGFVIHTKLMPARKTHCVTLVLAGSTVLGLYNATTGASVNYVRQDPPFLTEGLDILVLAVWSIVGCICAAMGWLGGLAEVLGGALAYLFLAMACRAMHRKRLCELVEDAMHELHLMRVVKPIRPLSK